MAGGVDGGRLPSMTVSIGRGRWTTLAVSDKFATAGRRVRLVSVTEHGKKIGAHESTTKMQERLATEHQVLFFGKDQFKAN
jgi:hypothetical protein